MTSAIKYLLSSEKQKTNWKLGGFICVCHLVFLCFCFFSGVNLFLWSFTSFAQFKRESIGIGFLCRIFTDDLAWTFLSDWRLSFLYCSCGSFLSWLLILTWLPMLQCMETTDRNVLLGFQFSSWSCLFMAEKSSAARAELSLVFRLGLEDVEATCSGEQRSFSFLHVRHWLCTPSALIYCPLTKTCDYTPFFPVQLPSAKSFCFLYVSKAIIGPSLRGDVGVRDITDPGAFC